MTAQPIDALEWDVVLFGFGRWGSGGSGSSRRRGRGSRRASARRVGQSAAVSALCIDERKALQPNPEFTLFLMSVLIFPLVELEPAFHEDRAALLEVLGDDLALSIPSLHRSEEHTSELQSLR